MGSKQFIESGEHLIVIDVRSAEVFEVQIRNKEQLP